MVERKKNAKYVGQLIALEQLQNYYRKVSYNIVWEVVFKGSFFSTHSYYTCYSELCSPASAIIRKRFLTFRLNLLRLEL